MLIPPISADRARQIASGFGRVHVVVIGDAMLDKFIVGRVTRISPEAPVPVVAFSHEMHRIGGSANVAHNIAALGAQATLVAVTGQDEGAATLAQACREAGIAPSLVGDPGRPTTTKVRIVTDRNQQVARVDYEEDAEVTDEIEQRITAEIQKHAERASAIVISDYLKGCVTRKVVEAAVAAAGVAGGIPVLVDPKIPHVDYYAKTTVVTPNHHEAEIAASMRVRTDDEARAAARMFRDRAQCAAVVMTRGDQGMWVLADVEGHLPAAAREVSDVTGAGDTVIATLALAIASGATMAEAARLANEAAGIAVGKFGPTAISAGELLSAYGSSAEIG